MILPFCHIAGADVGRIRLSAGIVDQDGSKNDCSDRDALCREVTAHAVEGARDSGAEGILANSEFRGGFGVGAALDIAEENRSAIGLAEHGQGVVQ